MNEAPVASYEPQAGAASVDEPEAATVGEESEAPTLPPSLASILVDEGAPSAEPTIEASTDSAEPSEEPVAPSAAAPQPAPTQTTQRSEPVRQPTSALVGRFWSRVGKSRR